MEPIHRLRLSLRSWLSEGSTQIVITSSELDAGQSLLAGALAMSLSQSGRKVLLIDTDNLHPSLHHSFPDQPLMPGLSEFLAHPHNNVWASIVRPVADNLKLITAGGVSRSSSLLSSDKVPLLMEKARVEADIVIYNAAPTSESAAAMALLSPETYLLVLVSMNHTHVPSLKLLSTQLKPHVCRGSGLVLANANDYAVVAALSRAERDEDLDAVPV
jgi:Mrp family chromosome partitioning ATPase